MAARKLEPFGTKLIDKIMTHLADDIVEKLESFLVGKARTKQMVNVGQFVSRLIHLNVLDENDMQLRAGLLTTDEENWTEKAIRKACSKRAFGSLVVALQSSGNEGILEETFEWLENAPKGTESHTPSTNLDTSQAVTTNNVILRKVFEYIDSAVLCNLALVNKLWKQEATSLIRQRSDLYYNIQSGGTCSAGDVEILIDHVMRLFGPMEIAPVGRIVLNISPQGPACPSPIVLPMLEQVLDTLSLKSLSLNLSGTWLDHQNCPRFKLAKGLLQDQNGSLANLQLKITSGREEFIQLLQHCSFPSLKVLRLEDDQDTANEAYTNYFRALLSRAPNLQELYFSGVVDLSENFLGDRQQEVLVYPDLVWAPYIADSVLGSLRLKALTLLPCSNLNDQYFQRFMRTLPTLLGTCCSRTLKELWVDPMIALSLMRHGVVLENVEYLNLCCSYEVWEHLEPRILQNFSKFDFTSIFPKLTAVHATPTQMDSNPLPHHMEGLIQEVANVNAMPDRAANVIYLGTIGLSDQTLDFYVELFPHIQALSYRVRAHDEVPMSIGSIWKLNWYNLRTLIIAAKMEMLAQEQEDLDCVFCGIFPEEVAELREKTDEYLKDVHIVPVKPSFTHLKNLSAFKLEYSDDVDAELACGMSKVTGLIAFARLPNLAVEITTKRRDVYEALEHMKAYASVVHLES